jgi:hypothetical protein
MVCTVAPAEAGGITTSADARTLALNEKASAVAESARPMCMVF